MTEPRNLTATVRPASGRWPGVVLAFAIASVLVGACQTGVPTASNRSPTPASSGAAVASPGGSSATTSSPFPTGPSATEEPPYSPLPPPRMESADGPLVVDKLGEVLTSELNLRAGPATSSERLGVLPKDGTFLVLAGPQVADGYAWYQIAAVPQDAVCLPSQPPLLSLCTDWLGWAAAASPAGERWLGALAIDCPVGRAAPAYLSMLPAQRLACGGSLGWQLTVYLAPSTDGRGCAPGWTTEPAWLDGSCNFLFPLLAPAEFDANSSLQVWAAPGLGSCASLGDPRCELGRYRGSWVTLIGHLDDPAARSCRAVPSGIEGTVFDPPTPDQVVLDCRLRLVVTEAVAISVPAPSPPTTTAAIDQPPGFAIASVPFTNAIDVSNTVGDARGFGHCDGHATDVWYRYTAPQDETLAVDTLGSNYDTVLDVWTWPLNLPINDSTLDTGLTDMVAVACNNDANGLTTSEVVFAAKAGRTYVIRVSLGTFEAGLLNFHLSRG